MDNNINTINNTNNNTNNNTTVSTTVSTTGSTTGSTTVSTTVSTNAERVRRCRAKYTDEQKMKIREYNKKYQYNLYHSNEDYRNYKISIAKNYYMNKLIESN